MNVKQKIVFVGPSYSLSRYGVERAVCISGCLSKTGFRSAEHLGRLSEEVTVFGQPVELLCGRYITNVHSCPYDVTPVHLLDPFMTDVPLHTSYFINSVFVSQKTSRRSYKG